MIFWNITFFGVVLLTCVFLFQLPFAREGHASTMLKPQVADLRRRRLLMDGPGDVDIATG